MQFSRYIKMRASHPDRLSSVITYTNLFVYLITGETSYHNSTALLTGLAVISCCSSVPVSMPKDFVRSFRTLVDWYFRILGEVFSNLSFLKFPSDLVFFFLNLAATYSPTPSPVQYHRPFRSLPSCSGWERVLPLSASPPKRLVISVRAGLARSNPLCVSSLVQSLIYIFDITSAFVSKLTRICASKSVHSLIDN